MQENGGNRSKEERTSFQLKEITYHQTQQVEVQAGNYKERELDDCSEDPSWEASEI